MQIRKGYFSFTDCPIFFSKSIGLKLLMRWTNENPTKNLDFITQTRKIQTDGQADGRTDRQTDDGNHTMT